MNSASYIPLSHELSQTRLVTISKGCFEEDIHCSLAIVTLEDRPSYEALSYTWGDLSTTKQIYLGQSAHQVTINLEAALRHLRYVDRSRVIWIDALCINQNDILERNQQVAIMGNIYKAASKVIAWLGEDGEYSNLAFEMITALSRDDHLHWDPQNKPCVEEKFLSAEYIRGVSMILQRSWWHRIWTLQESILARELVFVCGHRWVPAEVLFTFSRSFFTHTNSCCYGIWRLHEGAILRALNEHMATLYMLKDFRNVVDLLNIQDMISLFRTRRCTDPRDMIYGLAGLATGRETGMIVPDYAASISDVYEQATLKLIENAQDLRILSQNYSPFEEQQQNQSFELASWVPNWTAEGTYQNFRDLHIRFERLYLYDACAGSASSVKHVAPGKIGIRGRIIGSISSLGEARGSGESRNDNEIYKRWRIKAGISDQQDRPYWTMPQQKKVLKVPSLSQSTLRAEEAREAPDPSDPATHPQSTFSRSDAFYQTLCSSVIPSQGSVTQTTQIMRITDSNSHLHRKWHGAWWDWITLHESEPSQIAAVCSAWGCSVAEVGAFLTCVSASTSMRRLFVVEAEEGPLGLAPWDARVGDCVAVVQGGRVPLILRPDGQAGARCWILVGDAYVHGLMDGEGMGTDMLEEIILV